MTSTKSFSTTVRAIAALVCALVLSFAAPAIAAEGGDSAGGGATVASSDALEFLYIDYGELSAGVEQNIVASLGDSYGTLESVQLYLQDSEGEDAGTYEATKLVDSSALFSFDTAPYGGGDYHVAKLCVTTSTGSYTVTFDDCDTCTFTVSDGVAVLGLDDEESSSEEATVTAYALDEDGTMVVTDSVEGALAEAQSVAGTNSASANSKIVIALDPGHGGYDSGATGNGLQEKDLTWKIANYCKEALENTYGVTVVLTRTENECPSLKERAQRAADAGSTVCISIHTNSANGQARGAEVWVPNGSSFNHETHEIGTQLGEQILDKLESLGLYNRGVKTRDYSSDGGYYRYSDGSEGDYYGIIRNSRELGLTGIIIEHAFIDSYSDATGYLNSDAKLKALGVADAQGIAKDLSLFGEVKTPLYGFTDVFDDTDHCSEIGWLAAAGISTGYADGSFGVDKTVKRGDMAAFLYRLAGSPDYTPSAEDKARFSDVSESTDHAKEIWWLAANGISTGYADGTFRPSGEVARCDMAAFLRRFTTKFIDATAADWDASEATKSFSDVSSSTSHYEDILWLAYAGVTTGYGDGTYRPASTVARQDMAAFLYRVNGLPSFTATSSQKTAFSDVNSSTSHAQEIWWLAYAGISTGYGDGTFKPSSAVTREDMAAFLYRLAGSPDYTPSAEDKARFSDVSESTDHAKEIWWLAANGISTGYGDGTFRPRSTVVRQDMAAFLKRMYDKFGANDFYDDWGTSDKAAYLVSDVTSQTEHSAEIYWLATTGISTGYADGTFRGGEAVLRQDMAAFLYRLYIRMYRPLSERINHEVEVQDSLDTYTIMGQTTVTASQMAAYYNSMGKSYPSGVYASKGAATIEDFCNIVVEEANAEGVKAEVVFCQAMLETAWLQFGGDVSAEQCNFAGIGATGGGVKGNSFADVRTGIRAQVQHLKAYASTDALVNACVDPRFGYVTRGCAPLLKDLSGKWAADTSYATNMFKVIQGLKAQ